MLKGISGAKPKATAGKSAKAAAKGQPSLEEFISKRDYMGALALLEFKLRCQDGDMKDLLLWIGYCAFHLGNFHRSEEAYKELFNAYPVGEEVHLYQACCYFYQQMYDEAERAAEKGPASELRTRLLFNIAHRTGNEEKLMKYHNQLKDRKADQLSLAAVHYLRSHFQEVRAWVLRKTHITQRNATQRKHLPALSCRAMPL
jgi:intraflagellar transport protein 56